LPPPVLTLSPSTGVLGTKVLVQGSGFPNPSAGPFPSTVEVEMSFDNQLLGFIFLQGSSFNFTFNVPLSQPGLHKVHAVELYPFSLDVTADFTVLAQPTPSVLTVSVNVGAIYFPGETTSIFVLSSLNGQPTPASSLQVVLIRPNGSRLALSPVSIGIGEWKATFTVPVSGSIGTYVVNAHVHVGNTGAGSDGSAITVFEVKPTWLQGHTTTLVGATATIGALGIVAVAWRKGFLTRRKEEFPT